MTVCLLDYGHHIMCTHSSMHVHNGMAFLGQEDKNKSMTQNVTEMCQSSCRVLSLSDRRYSLNPLSQTRID